MAEGKKATSKKAFNPEQLNKALKDGVGKLPKGAIYRGAVKALVMAQHQLQTAILEDKKKK